MEKSNKTEEVLSLFKSMSREEKIQTLEILLNKYTTNQVEATHLADVHNGQVVTAVDRGTLRLVHEYGKGKYRSHRVFLLEDIVKYANTMRNMRDFRNMKFY